MNLAIQHLQRTIRETEVQLQKAQDAHKVHERTAADSSAHIVGLTALLADLRAAATALPVVALKAVEPAQPVAPVTAAPAVATPSEAKAKKR